MRPSEMFQTGPNSLGQLAGQRSWLRASRESRGFLEEKGQLFLTADQRTWTTAVACQTAVKRFTAIAKLLSAAAAFCGIAALMLSAALVGSTAASPTTAAAATPGLMEVIKAVHVHKGILAAAVLAAAAATACLVGAAKARDMLQNITGYVYPRSKIQKDLQKVAGRQTKPH